MTTISPWMMTDEMRASDRRYDEATRLATNDLAKYIETEGKHSSLALTEAFRTFDVASPEQASLSPMQKAQIMFVNALGHGQSR